VNLTNVNFRETLESATVPVLVDYWAEWCRPCRTLSPIIDQLGQEMEGKLMVAKVDVEQNQELAFGLVSIPTLRLYVNGEVVKEIIGAHPKPYLLKELAEWL